MSWISAAASAVGGALGLVGQSSANSSNIKQQKLANEGNLELAKYQYDTNLEQWHRENEYNTPAAQLQRYIDAGLNPNLIYGNSNTSVSSPQYSAPTLGAYTGQKSSLGAGISSFADSAQIANLFATNENLKTQNDALRQNIITEGLRQSKLAVDTAQSEFDLGLAETLQETTLEAAQANVDKVKAEINNTKANTRFTLSNTELNKLRGRYTESQIANLEIATAKLYQDYDIDSYRNDLERIGIRPNDDIVARLVGRVINEGGAAIEENTSSSNFFNKLSRFIRNK